MTKETVLVCGGRDFDDYTWLAETLDAYSHRLGGINKIRIIHGDYRGADKLADKWAKERGVEVKPFPADWKKHGRRAGPIRNQQMLEEGEPMMVIAFPGADGTADMVDRALSNHIFVARPTKGKL